jgi:hypothetical protein
MGPRARATLENARTREDLTPGYGGLREAANLA